MKMPPKEEKKRYNIFIKESSRTIIEKIAKIEDRSYSEIIDFALELLNKNYE